MILGTDTNNMEFSLNKVWTRLGKDDSKICLYIHKSSTVQQQQQYVGRHACLVDTRMSAAADVTAPAQLRTSHAYLPVAAVDAAEM